MEAYASKLEKVVFKGYQKEAEVFLNAKLNKEDFENLKTNILEEKKQISKVFEENEEIFQNLQNKLDGLNSEIRVLRSQVAENEENKHVTIEYTDIDSEKTIDFDDLDYNNITNLPMTYLAKRVLKPMLNQIEKIKKKMDNDEDMADMINEKEMENNKKMLLSQQNEDTKLKAEEALKKIEDIMRENQLQNEKIEGKLR